MLDKNECDLWRELLHYSINLGDAICALFLIAIFSAFLFLVSRWCSNEHCLKRKKPQQFSIKYFKNFQPSEKDVQNFHVSDVSSSRSSFSGEVVSFKSDSTLSADTASDNQAHYLYPVINSLGLTRALKQKIDEEPTSVCLSLKLESCDNGENPHGKLHISIYDVSALPPKMYPCYAEVYVKIQLVERRRTFITRKENVIFRQQTRCVRHCRNILLNEHFTVEVRRDGLKNLSVDVTICNQDMYVGPTEICADYISLKEKFKDLCAHSDGIEVIKKLPRIYPENGNIMVGLSYLPTSQRLSVNLLKVANIPGAFNYKPSMYAQTFLITGVNGRSLKRKKVLFEPATELAELNGNVSFDVTAAQLETITLLIVLCYKEKNDEDKNIEGKDAPSMETESKVGQSRNIGKLALGSLVFGDKEKKHWEMMITSPRRVVTVWHTLK